MSLTRTEDLWYVSTVTINARRNTGLLVRGYFAVRCRGGVGNVDVAAPFSSWLGGGAGQKASAKRALLRFIIVSLSSWTSSGAVVLIWERFGTMSLEDVTEGWSKHPRSQVHIKIENYSSRRNTAGHFSPRTLQVPVEIADVNRTFSCRRVAHCLVRERH